jgi:hypothetical protein
MRLSEPLLKRIRVANEWSKSSDIRSSFLAGWASWQIYSGDGQVDRK